MITKVEEIKARYGAQEYTLPGWEPRAPFVCRLRRPQLTAMSEIAGFIPNPLLGVVDEMFMPTGKKVPNPTPEQRTKIMRLFAKYALVEPTLDELDAAGVQLTDEQYMAIWLLAIGGIESLTRFLDTKRRLTEGDGAAVSGRAVKPAKP